MAFKITSFLIALVWVGVITSIFALFMAELNTSYEPATYDNSTFNSYNNLAYINELAQNMTTASELEEDASKLDLFGGFFSDAYNAFLITRGSITQFDAMSNKGIEQANLGYTGVALKSAITAIIIILVIIGWQQKF